MIEESTLAKIVGQDGVSSDAMLLAAYSRDISFVNAVRPRCVVKPGNSQAIEELVKLANETQTPLVPVSSGPAHFRGDTAPLWRSCYRGFKPHAPGN